MRKIRGKNLIRITFLILSFFMMFHPISGEGKSPKEQMDNERKAKYDKNISIMHNNTINPKEKEIDSTYTYDENMINEEDVLYMAVYMDVFRIDFLDEEGKVCSIGSLKFLEKLRVQIEQKKLIWIYVVQNTFKFTHCLGTGEDIQQLINNIMKKKHVVIDPIKNNTYKLYIDHRKEPDQHLNRLRDLDLVWWHILSEHANGYSLTFYNPVSIYCIAISFVRKIYTLISVTLDVFIEESINFKKAFIIFGFNDENSEKDYAVTRNKAPCTKKPVIIGYYELFSMLRYKANQLLLDKLKNKKYPYIKMNILSKKEYIKSIQNSPMHIDPSISQSVDISSSIPENNPETTPIYLINTGFHYINIQDAHFETLLPISHPKISKIYFNVFNQKTGYNKYCITGYSTLYVDFSYCIINTLYEGCFDEFFSKTEYVLIRDIDYRNLRFLLACRFSRLFPYIKEIPVDKDGLLIVSSKPLKVHIDNEELREFFPKMAMKNMVYCYTEHMLFMKSTLRAKADSEQDKRKMFDVFIFKKPLIESLTIEEEEETNSEIQTREKEIKGVEYLFNITQGITKLRYQKKNSSRKIVILDYSFISEDELRCIIHQIEAKLTLQKKPLDCLIQKEIPQENTPSSSATSKKRPQKRNNSSSNNEEEPATKKPNTSPDNRIYNEQAGQDGTISPCSESLESASNTFTYNISTLSTLSPTFSSNSHTCTNLTCCSHHNNTTENQEDNTCPQTKDTWYEDMQYIGIHCGNNQVEDAEVYSAIVDGDVQPAQLWTNSFIGTEDDHVSSVFNKPFDSLESSSENHTEIDDTLTTYGQDILDLVWTANA
ncbi:hypothetical protein NEFER03_2252 [Nematocida sp. LUAm3]|nr:hypothetical protein NEFER03_2252 [Nematocida sp. LUAm3]KAI5176487.1 hypothetical protein NEFER02_2231 [Nematocida sp. LUAm2]KAI5179418.1 hypothetical protein NEFER01_2238 [Nematocida sp. LUAm1]